jgi:hypothetical protein
MILAVNADLYGGHRHLNVVGTDVLSFVWMLTFERLVALILVFVIPDLDYSTRKVERTKKNGGLPRGEQAQLTVAISICYGECFLKSLRGPPSDVRRSTRHWSASI